MRPTLRRTPALGQVLAAALLLGQVAAAAEGGLRILPAVKVNQPGLTARQIVEKAREAAKRNGKGNAVFTFLRKARIEDLDSKGNIRKGYTKTYRAYTDGRDQELVKVDGKPASRQASGKSLANKPETVNDNADTWREKRKVAPIKVETWSQKT